MRENSVRIFAQFDEIDRGTQHEYSKKDSREVEAVKVGPADITVDGTLDEVHWIIASPATGFVQFEPLNGKASSENTEVRILYDEFNLYIGAILYDSAPDGIIADEMKRDADLERNDNFMVIIDTYHDRRNGFFFQTNPLGAQVDALVFDEGNWVNYDWDGLWWVEAKTTSKGWQLEIRIPFSTLRYSEKSFDLWGVQFGRLIRRKNESTYWTFIPLDASQWRLSLAGHLTQLKEIEQRKSIEIKPYAQIQRIEKNISEERTDWDVSVDGGGDIKYFITPNLIANLTINPDFAQVEADELKINVSRFPLFFPEKREYFLEGSGYFDFGISEKVQPFYSRRVGIADGKEIPIILGGKLSGKVGKYGLGLLSVQTKEESDEPETNYSVIRIKRDILKRSSVGLIMISKEPHHSEYNRTFGADLNLRLFDSIYIDSFIIQTDTEGVSAEENAGYLSIAWQDPVIYVSASYLDVDESFNPEAGFVKRTGIKESVAYGAVSLRPSASVIRKYMFSTSFVYISDQENRMIGKDVNAGLATSFHNGSYIDVFYLNAFERLDDEFEIRPGIIIPDGDYISDTISLSASSDTSRKISGYAFLSYGNYYTGDRTTYSLAVSMRPSQHIKIAPSYTREEVDLPQGSFDANLVTASLGYTFSTKAFINALIQWNDDSELFSSNIRFNYEYDPGSDIYLVYNETRSTSGNEFKEQAIVLKVTKLWSF